jgi:MFS superfamily sulfate permease-like transporter
VTVSGRSGATTPISKAFPRRARSAVNDKAGARTPLALIFASCALALCLLFLTGLLANLPKTVLAAVVLTAVYGCEKLGGLDRLRTLDNLLGSVDR